MPSLELFVALVAIGVTMLTGAAALVFQSFALREKKGTAKLGTLARESGYMFGLIGLITIFSSMARYPALWTLIVIGLLGLGAAILFRKW